MRAIDRAKNVLRCSCGLEVQWGGGLPDVDVDLLKYLVDGHSHHWNQWVELTVVVQSGG